MNERLLFHYNRELEHLREGAIEFARRYPKVAGRLDLDTNSRECRDPYVERLIEGVAYLTARVQLKLEAEFPRFTSGILETVAPHYLAPLPAMLIAQFEPELADAALASGPVLKRKTSLRSRLGVGINSGSTACEFSTAHEIRLWPLQLKDAAYVTRGLEQLGNPPPAGARSAIRIGCSVTAGVTTKGLKLDRLPIFIDAEEGLAGRIYEDLFSSLVGVAVQWGTGKQRRSVLVPGPAIRPMGFESDEALLPPMSQSFEGYRILTEYFHFPKRFLFFELRNLAACLQSFDSTTFDLVLYFNEADPILENRVDGETFRLYCTPAINLVEKRLDYIDLQGRFSEYHVVADRTRPLDYEIHTITRVEGLGQTHEDTQTFQPFYFNYDRALDARAYYTMRRAPRQLSERELSDKPVSDYRGTESFLSIVDGNQAPWKPELTQLSLSALCSNRHLPIRLTMGGAMPEFDISDFSGSVLSTRCVGYPAPPRLPLPWVVPSPNEKPPGEGELTWKILSHLSLNYLSLTESDHAQSAAAMREILHLYALRADASMQQQIRGLTGIASKPTLCRAETPGPIAFARGLEVTLDFNDTAFVGSGLFLFASVIDRFLSKYVSINSFVQTVLRREGREVHKWKARPGLRPVL